MSKKTQPALPTPEWSRRFEIAALGNRPLRQTLTIRPDESKDLARRLKIEAIEDLQADLTVERRPGGHVVQVSGQVKATVRQACVVTLAPVVSRIEEPVEGWFSDEAQAVTLSRARRDRGAQRADAEIEISSEAEDPEPVVDGAVDLGELATQFLSLAIDPFPRCDAAKEEADEPPLPARPNPFAALKDWKAGQGNKK